MPDAMLASKEDVEASREKRLERIKAKRRDRGGIFQPAETNPLLDMLMSRDVSGKSPTKTTSVTEDDVEDHESPKRTAANAKKATESKPRKRTTKSSSEKKGANLKTDSSTNVKASSSRNSKPSKGSSMTRAKGTKKKKTANEVEEDDAPVAGPSEIAPKRAVTKNSGRSIPLALNGQAGSTSRKHRKAGQVADDHDASSPAAPPPNSKKRNHVEKNVTYKIDDGVTGQSVTSKRGRRAATRDPDGPTKATKVKSKPLKNDQIPTKARDRKGKGKDISSEDAGTSDEHMRSSKRSQQKLESILEEDEGTNQQISSQDTSKFERRKRKTSDDDPGDEAPDAKPAKRRARLQGDQTKDGSQSNVKYDTEHKSSLVKSKQDQVPSDPERGRPKPVSMSSSKNSREPLKSRPKSQSERIFFSPPKNPLITIKWRNPLEIGGSANMSHPPRLLGSPMKADDDDPLDILQ